MAIVGARVRYSAVNYNYGGDYAARFALPTNSRVVSVYLVWTEPVELDPGAITLSLHKNGVSYAGLDRPNGYGSVPSFNMVQADGRSNTWILRQFYGDVIEGEDGVGTIYDGYFNSVQDGVYGITVDGSKVYTLDDRRSLDWYGVFWRLFGEVTGAIAGPSALVTPYSATVNSADNLVFRNSFGSNSQSSIFQAGDQDRYPGYRRWLDYYGDGVINSIDNLNFLANFGATLSWMQ